MAKGGPDAALKLAANDWGARLGPQISGRFPEISGDVLPDTPLWRRWGAVMARIGRATSHEPRAASHGSRTPVPDSRPLAVRRCHCHSAIRTPQSAMLFPVPRFRFPNPESRIPAVSRSPFPVPGSRRCFSATSYAQRRMRIRACKKPSNSIKFGSKSIKKTTFSVKKASKKRAFRHAHLNILPLHPLWR